MHLGHLSSLLSSERCCPSELQDDVRKLCQLSMQYTGYEEQHACFQLECNKHMQQMTKFMELVRHQQDTFKSHKILLRLIRAHVHKLLQEIIQLTNQLALQSIRRSATS